MEIREDLKKVKNKIIQLLQIQLRTETSYTARRKGIDQITYNKLRYEPNSLYTETIINNLEKLIKQR